MTWQIWFAVAAIVLTIVGLVKRLETRMLLVVAGFCMCAVAGEPLKAFQSFVKGMTNPTLVPAICSAMGFAAAVTASKCDQHLVAAVAAPLKKLHSEQPLFRHSNPASLKILSKPIASAWARTCMEPGTTCARTPLAT